MINRGIGAFIAGWLLTSLLLSLYFSLHFVIPAAGDIEPELAGWQFRLDYFLTVLPFSLAMGLLVITAGLLVQRIFQKSGYVNYWSVAVAGTLLGLLNPFLHEVAAAIPFTHLVFALGVIAVPVGWLMAFWLSNRVQTNREKSMCG